MVIKRILHMLYDLVNQWVLFMVLGLLINANVMFSKVQLEKF